MKKAMVALWMVVVMLLGVSYIYAQEQGGGTSHGWMHGQEHPGQWNKLSLTPEQKAKFQELRRKFIKETAQLRGELVTKRLELKLLWTDPKANSQAILAKERELRDLQNRMRDKIIQHKLEFRNSLTPEQIEKLGMMGRRHYGFHHHHHHQGMGHSGM